MTKEELLKILKDCDQLDWESGHSQADEALIDFINDEDIAEAYENIGKWYA